MKKNAVKWSVNPKTHSSPRQLHHRCHGRKPQSLANRAASAHRGSGSATAALGTKTWQALKDIIAVDVRPDPDSPSSPLYLKGHSRFQCGGGRGCQIVWCRLTEAEDVGAALLRSPINS